MALREYGYNIHWKIRKKGIVNGQELMKALLTKYLHVKYKFIANDLTILKIKTRKKIRFVLLWFGFVRWCFMGYQPLWNISCQILNGPNIYIYIYIRPIFLMGKVFADGWETEVQARSSHTKDSKTGTWYPRA